MGTVPVDGKVVATCFTELYNIPGIGNLVGHKWVPGTRHTSSLGMVNLFLRAPYDALARLLLPLKFFSHGPVPVVVAWK